MNPAAVFDVLQRLGLAALLGALIGFEREYRQKPAGLRTNTLIALGSALFAVVSLEFGGMGGTPDRVVAQVVTGIGFLGAGAIIRSGEHVHGLTTAATIWMDAAIGIACGIGRFAVAVSSTVLTLIVLAVLGVIERRVEGPHE
jgi:putative Mg2+ transporter-C (MgtC) family protein